MATEDELLKHNTDCVYFLASPLTCKKGIDCEYRHSEMARFNPRDCWYWLNWNCLNPLCAFRHPPLEAPAEAPPDSATLQAAPVNKINAPCYFYFSGFCNKGDKCSFVHDPDGSTPAGRYSNVNLSIAETLHVKNKTSGGNDAGFTLTEENLNPLEVKPEAALNIRYHAKEDFQLIAPKDVLKQSLPPQNSRFDCEPLVSSDTLPQREGCIQNSSHLSSDNQSSEEQVGHDLMEPETLWESSPGFDVLVDDQSENLGSEDDPEFALTLDREKNELSCPFLGYDFENMVEYEPTYSDTELLNECQLYDSYNHLDGHVSHDVGRIPNHFRERMFHSIISQDRKLMPMKLGVHIQNRVDLRERLRKRRPIDARPIAHLTRRRDRSRLIGKGQERPRRFGSTHRWMHGILASEVATGNFIYSHNDNVTLSSAPANHCDFFRNSRLNNTSRQYHKKRLAKRHHEMSTKPVLRERSSQETDAFTGPKTLSQIKADFVKRTHSSHSSRASTDFQGPKPLREILEEKRRGNSS